MVTFAASKMDMDSRKKSECGKDEVIEGDDAVMTICRQKRSMWRC
jgi:hypothetical protein